MTSFLGDGLSAGTRRTLVAFLMATPYGNGHASPWADEHREFPRARQVHWSGICRISPTHRCQPTDPGGLPLALNRRLQPAGPPTKTAVEAVSIDGGLEGERRRASWLRAAGHAREGAR